MLFWKIILLHAVIVASGGRGGGEVGAGEDEVEVEEWNGGGGLSRAELRKSCQA